MKRREFLGLGLGMSAVGGAGPASAATTATAESVGGYEPDTSRGAPIDGGFEYATRAMDTYQQGATLRLIQRLKGNLRLSGVSLSTTSRRATERANPFRSAAGPGCGLVHRDRAARRRARRPSARNT
jgi:hypothetical protein